MPGKDSYHHGDLKNALIEAGADILSKDGVSALSLRKVAQKAGVSHAAPYAHFADKQALIAAISTEGYKQTATSRSRRSAEQYRADPLRRLVEASWAYVQFALDEPDHVQSHALGHDREGAGLSGLCRDGAADLQPGRGHCEPVPAGRYPATGTAGS